MIEVRMPRLSEAMTEGKLLLWNVAVGDRVEAGDQLAEVEADKANMEIDAPASGVVLNLHGKPGDTVPVDTVLIELQEDAGSAGGDRPAKPSAAKTAEADVTAESPLEKRQKQFSGNSE